jgi:predicted nucleic acid-binding protein
MLVGERRRRLNQEDITQFTTLLESLSPAQDEPSITKHVNEVLPIARRHQLSAYGAAYLELSIRRQAPLATLDDRLQKAAKAAGIAWFQSALERDI